MSSEDKPIELVPAMEAEQISRKLMAWLNTFPDIPLSINLIDYEFLDANVPSMSMSLVQATYIIERFIHGPYIADYQFKIVYRCKPSTPDGRLSADELLDSLGDWATGHTPDIGAGLEVQELEQTTRSALFARLDGGWEDHQIFMRMTYMVNS